MRIFFVLLEEFSHHLLSDQAGPVVADAHLLVVFGGLLIVVVLADKGHEQLCLRHLKRNGGVLLERLDGLDRFSYLRIFAEIVARRNQVATEDACQGHELEFLVDLHLNLLQHGLQLCQRLFHVFDVACSDLDQARLQLNLVVGRGQK